MNSFKALTTLVVQILIFLFAGALFAALTGHSGYITNELYVAWTAIGLIFLTWAVASIIEFRLIRPVWKYTKEDFVFNLLIFFVGMIAFDSWFGIYESLVIAMVVAMAVIWIVMEILARR